MCTGAVGGSSVRLNAQASRWAGELVVNERPRRGRACTCMHAWRERLGCTDRRTSARGDDYVHGQTRAADAERPGVGAGDGCAVHPRARSEPEMLEYNLGRLRYLCGKCAREQGEGGNGMGRLPLGNLWVPRPMRKNWEKARISIGRVFEARGSN
ncbi:hypothetical protein CRG98_019906 [Punica granatum]|uniref:Uncharacterized protein n=1 Tax=Punica granatum TaxID=22663 RepID=A0A2I0JV15_PUNGR|nr:hypothetical protein CRG98_019906 [Punica granatum]